MTTSFSTENREAFFREQLDEAHFRIAGLEEELAAKRKAIKSLERQIAKYESEGVKQGLVEDLFEVWRNLTGHSRAVLTTDRRKVLTTSVKQRDEQDTRKIIVQGAKTPYLVYGHWKASGSPDSKRDDLTDFLGKGKYAEQLLALANTTQEKPLSEEQMADWHTRLLSTEAVLNRITELKGWTETTLETLGVGFDGGRLVFPVRDSEGELLGATRYFPGDRKKDVPKAIAVGPRGLFPAPETLDSSTVWLVEGEPDAVTAHEMWLPGVAVPGASVAPGEWMARLKGKKVVICFDCDHAGRSAANRIARPLTQYATEVRVVDLDPSRADGFDLTDWFRQGRTRKTLEAMVRLVEPVSSVLTPSLPQQTFDSNPNEWDGLFDDFVRALEQKDCDPKEGRGGQWTARCPAHDDKVPTLHFRRGDRTPVVGDCKAGCTWPDIKDSLAWPSGRE